MHRLRLLANVPGLLLALAYLAPATARGGEASAAPLRLPQLPANARLGALPDQMARALVLDAKPEAWNPRVHKTRGAAGVLYGRVAPSTVIVRTPWGHGSGVIVDPSGWILTNAHCVEQGSTDAATGAQRVVVHVGRMEGDLMQLDSEGVPGIVYKKDSGKDLALVKLSNLPQGTSTLPALRLSERAPRPGSECVVLGHPAAGMLWTVRSCEVAGVGTWPTEQIDYVFQRLSASTTEDQEKLAAIVSQMTPVKILLSSCGLNPGDSGGPLVNGEGELIALTFAIPASERYDKFAYHVHLDELRAFLENRPASPPLHVPPAWPPAACSAALDLDQNGRNETLLFGLEPGGAPTGMLADLDESFLGDFTPEQLAQAGAEFAWDFEFGWQPAPEGRAFYDTNDDGDFDQIHVDTDREGSTDVLLKQTRGTWGRQEGEGRALVDLTQVPQPMREQCARILMALTHGTKAKEPAAAQRGR